MTHVMRSNLQLSLCVWNCTLRSVNDFVDVKLCGYVHVST